MVVARTTAVSSHTRMRQVLVLGLVLAVVFVCSTQARPQLNLGSLFVNGVGAVFNTAIARDCKGRPQGDYFYGCQCVGPFHLGRRKRSPVDTRFFINSNQGIGGDFARCSLGTLLNRNG